MIEKAIRKHINLYDRSYPNKSLDEFVAAVVKELKPQDSPETKPYDFKLGDRVISEFWGEGVVVELEPHRYPIGVLFSAYDSLIYFTEEGQDTHKVTSMKDIKHLNEVEE